MLGILFVTILPFSSNAGSEQIPNPHWNSGGSAKICIKNICIEAEIAATPEARINGLMFRQELEPGKGMLFILGEESKESFWMKNMKFPLDIIWINKDKVIIEISKDARPCLEDCLSISPKEKASYVLEVNSGFCDRFDIKAGDKVQGRF